MWGLPKKYFYPEKLLNHAFSLLKDKGQMLIVNQGEYEAIEQKKLLDQIGVQYVELGEISSKYLEYRHKRFGFCVKK